MGRGSHKHVQSYNEMTQDATFKELDMAVHVSLHRAPGLSQEEIDGFAPEVAKGVHATFLQLFVNTDTGFIVTVYEAESAEAVEQEFERIGFPFEAIHEVDVVLNAADLAALVAGAPHA